MLKPAKKKKGLMLLKINDPLSLFDRKFQQYTVKHQQKCLEKQYGNKFTT